MKLFLQIRLAFIILAAGLISGCTMSQLKSVFPSYGPLSPWAYSLSGCSQSYCGPKRCRQDFCVYDDECEKDFCTRKRVTDEVTELRCQVEDGHMYAAVCLGHMYLVGDGVCKDLNQAHCWYCKAANAGIPVAQVQMGNFYRDGCVVPRDPCAAIAWYQKAANQGDVSGILALAEMYRGWHGAMPDRAKALKLYERAAACGSADAEFQSGLLLMHSSQKEAAYGGIERIASLAEEGHPEAMAAIGDVYYEGRLGPRDLSKAYYYWNKSAKLGSPLAAFKLGMAYSSGECAPRDLRVAAEWYITAAKRGYPDAQLMLANLYREGRGVVKDYRLAADWYFRAAKHNLWRAQLELADFYHAGKGGLPRYLEEAVRRYTIASDFGCSPYASLMLSIMYEEGRGVTQDLMRSVEYYEKAKCQPGFVHALYKIGRRFEMGYGLPKNMVDAIRWYCRAANCGSTLAQVALGDLYYVGKCVPRDYGQAFDWYYKAALCGNSYAQNMLGLILLEGDCLPQYAETVVPGFRFKGKVAGLNCIQCCPICKQTLCVCEPAYSERSGNGCAVCALRIARCLYVQCRCNPRMPCSCGARNAYRIPAWCCDVCSPRHKACGPIKGRCTVAISKENARRAAKWIHQAAICGAGQAQFQLGILYMNGIGVPKDEGKAYAWLHTAMECMEDKNPDVIRCLIDRMTPEMKRRAVCLAEKAKARYRVPCATYPSAYHDQSND